MPSDAASDLLNETRERAGANVPPHRVSIDAAWEAAMARQLRPLVAHSSADVTIALAHLNLATAFVDGVYRPAIPRDGAFGVLLVLLPSVFAPNTAWSLQGRDLHETWVPASTTTHVPWFASIGFKRLSVDRVAFGLRAVLVYHMLAAVPVPAPPAPKPFALVAPFPKHAALFRCQNLDALEATRLRRDDVRALMSIRASGEYFVVLVHVVLDADASRIVEARRFDPRCTIPQRFLDRLAGQTIDAWFALNPNAPRTAFQALVWPATRSVVLLGCDAALRGLEAHGEDQDVLLYFYPTPWRSTTKKQKTTASLHRPALAIVTCFPHTDARLVARLLRVVAQLDTPRLFATLLRDHIAVLDANALSYAVQTLGPVNALPGVMALVLRATRSVPSLLAGVVAWTSQLQDEYLATPLTTLPCTMCATTWSPFRPPWPSRY
ncbi:hypothetical protein SDRG_09591 [Saprolegnia diclina VS20]|uniref:Uncharacterized protein n=1 Tax=Saprolegnia diclina (strain VS20) TaxID=1156394 RepID=T0RSF4_SAPDV|nr:hypothetical protein SDRG_09591 [Saprolegnia diclina VS20]EQC33072.1 hypothetical protein SDRG_09591 [Saprolegnia diclina VS20]|eukprot:XP_008613758.1 hypothetical protein SDRG_09591 [Saprolegnia diclina VS20]